MPNEVTKKIIVLGITGSGKSSICNLITRTNAFKTSNSPCSITQTAQQETITENGVKYEVVDTVGLLDTEKCQVLVRSSILGAIKECARGIDYFFLIIKLDRFTEHQGGAFDYLMNGILGPGSMENAVIVFTNSGDLCTDDHKKSEWLQSAKSNVYLRQLLEKVEFRILFVEAGDEKKGNSPYAVYMNSLRDESRQNIMKLLKDFRVSTYKLEYISAAQQDYDKKMRELEDEKRKTESIARKKEIEMETAKLKANYENIIAEYEKNKTKSWWRKQSFKWISAAAVGTLLAVLL